VGRRILRREERKAHPPRDIGYRLPARLAAFAGDRLSARHAVFGGADANPGFWQEDLLACQVEHREQLFTIHRSSGFVVQIASMLAISILRITFFM
jgi:hypothetical protein